MHYVNTALYFFVNCLLEKENYVVIEVLQIYCNFSFFSFFSFFFFFLKDEKLKKLAVALKFLTVLSLNSNVFLLILFACKDPPSLYKSSKRRNHLKPENLETPFLLSALKMPIKSLTNYRAKIKYLEDA